MHYWGSDIIQIDIAKAYTLLDENTLYDIYPLRNDGDIRKKIAKFEKFIDLSIVGDYSLLPYSIHSIVIRQAVDINNIPFVGCNEGKIQLKIVHAPTNRKIKGTAFVIDAVEQLKKQGYNIELIIVENRPHHEAMDIFKEADIVVDDLLQGPYGIFAIECMALGKPVLGRIDPKLIHNYPDLPIVNADPKNIYQKLIELIENTTLRRDIGLKGRIYVEKNHDHLLIATKILNLYHQL